jgi:hypothetical protein
LYFLLAAESSFLIGSRKEELVDKGSELRGDKVLGDHKCLFYKILYTISTLPLWLRPNIEKQHLHIVNFGNGSVIDGESTNESFGAGDRRLSVMVDEMGRMEPRIAQSIRETLSDVTNCVVYNSTHFYGKGHPFARLCTGGKVKVVKLPWYLNPVKKEGLYSSPDLNLVDIKDLEYYKTKRPDFNWNTTKASEIKKLTGVSFVADGSGKLRSPWYDREVARRDARDVAQNIDMNPAGSGDMFFDPAVINQHRQRFAKNPSWEGDIAYDVHRRYGLSGVRFELVGRQRLKWWGDLDAQLRPAQDVNYIIACDVAMGTGASNSVAKIYDVNNSKLIGMFVSASIPPEEFGEYVVALCRWSGGACGRPYLIWEATGPGRAFEARVAQLGYEFVYRDKGKRGWYSNKQLKYELLLGARVALANALKKDAKPALAVCDEDTLREYEDYVFTESGDIATSMSIDEDSGARMAHGDRVIPDGLYVLALKYQAKAAISQPAVQSLQWRWAQAERMKENNEEPWLIKSGENKW